jgi:hypothetical protein
MAEKVQTGISADLLEELCRRAKEQGRSEGELLEEAVRRYLERPGSLVELFESIDRGQRERDVEPLSEEEACVSPWRSSTLGGASGRQHCNPPPSLTLECWSARSSSGYYLPRE